MENQTFQYTYSAKEQEEVKKIREKYLPQEENKMDQLRRLDQSVTRKGTVLSLAVGILGTLVMGIGMCCCMVWDEQYFIPGIVIGVAGMLAAGLAYPLYDRITRKEREKVAPEILRLTQELLK